MTLVEEQIYHVIDLIKEYDFGLKDNLQGKIHTNWKDQQYFFMEIWRTMEYYRVL